jgi:ribosomal protein S18 acetylase RimI-like enzyme
MADERDKMLRDMAENRGCKLVKSRRRKPGGDFGRYGLKDSKSGQEVYGFGDDGLTASAEEIEAWLRGGAVAEWKRSLKAAAGAPQTKAKPEHARKPANDEPVAPARRRKAEASSPPPAPPPSPPPPPPPPPKPKLSVREAKPRDAEAIAALASELGFPSEAAAVRKRLGALAKRGEPVLVAEDEEVIGFIAWTVWIPVHRPKPVGRITTLVVTKKARGRGVGSALVAEAEARFLNAGCGLAEVTSNVELGGAHDFYRRRDYERTSWRFGKSLEDDPKG